MGASSETTVTITSLELNEIGRFKKRDITKAGMQASMFVHCSPCTGTDGSKARLSRQGCCLREQKKNARRELRVLHEMLYTPP
jgi:hypothetical protein